MVGSILSLSLSFTFSLLICVCFSLSPFLSFSHSLTLFISPSLKWSLSLVISFSLSEMFSHVLICFSLCVSPFFFLSFYNFYSHKFVSMFSLHELIVHFFFINCYLLLFNFLGKSFLPFCFFVSFCFITIFISLLFLLTLTYNLLINFSNRFSLLIFLVALFHSFSSSNFFNNFFSRWPFACFVWRCDWDAFWSNFFFLFSFSVFLPVSLRTPQTNSRSSLNLGSCLLSCRRSRSSIHERNMRTGISCWLPS